MSSNISIKETGRESQFEILRIIAIFFIVLSHILGGLGDGKPYTIIWPLLHTGVPLFVLISGYFGIKPSIKSFTKLIISVFILQVPLEILHQVLNGGGKCDILRCFLFISNTPFWYVRTYIILYLLSPVINTFLDKVSPRRMFLQVIILLYISDWFGYFKCDPSLIEGKNIMTFLLFYVTGRLIKSKKDEIIVIPQFIIVLFFILMNIIIMCFLHFGNEYLKNETLEISFYYNSFGVYINAVLLILMVVRYKFYSNTINTLAKSSLAIYLLHCSNIIFFSMIVPFNKQIAIYCGHYGFLFFVIELFFAISIVLVCHFAFVLCSPIISQSSKVCNIIIGNLFHRVR